MLATLAGTEVGLPSAMRLAFLLALCACQSSSLPHGSGVDSMPGGTCGGFVAATCAADLFCDFSKDNCGTGDQPGTCIARPADCPDTQAVPTCGCDGMIRNSVCETQMAGVDVAVTGRCTAPAGTFACGFTFCNSSATYCEHRRSATGPDEFACRLLPTACGAFPSCACLAGEPCGQSCSGDPSSGLTATCPS
jgi:hypothetical protein